MHSKEWCENTHLIAETMLINFRDINSSGTIIHDCNGHLCIIRSAKINYEFFKDNKHLEMWSRFLENSMNYLSSKAHQSIAST